MGINDIIKDFKGCGLLKQSMDEAYLDTDEATTSANVAAQMTPLDVDGGRPDEQEESSCQDEACQKLESAIKQLYECYQQLGGVKQIGEMFCSDCTVDDLSMSDTSDGNQSSIDNVANIYKKSSGDK